MLENSVHKRIICNTLYLKKQTIHSVIKSGDVYLEPSPENSKIKMIILTEKGKAIYEKTDTFFWQQKNELLVSSLLKREQLL